MRASTIKRRWAVAATASIASMLLVGCATLGGKPEQAVEKRSNAYWKARVTADYVKAYELSAPSYRKLRTAEQFRRQFGAGSTVKGAETTKVTCEAERCTAQVRISATPALVGLNVGTIDTYVNEIWLLEDGQWWHYQDL